MINFILYVYILEHNTYILMTYYTIKNDID